MDVETTENNYQVRLGNITGRLERQESEITKLAAGQARLESNDSAIMRELKAISDVVHRPRDNNTTAWIGAILATFTVLGALSLAYLTPMQDDIKDLQRDLREGLKGHDIQLRKGESQRNGHEVRLNNLERHEHEGGR